MSSRTVELAIVGISQDGGVPQPDAFAGIVELPKKPSMSFPSSCALREKDGSFHLIEATKA